MTTPFEPTIFNRRKFSGTMAAVFCALLLTACSAKAKGAATMNPIAGKTGILQTSAGTYEFTLASCGIFKEGDIDDIEIRGAGKTPKGEKFHFDLTSTGNEMTINLGVDQPFKSSDRQIRAGQYVSQPFRLVVTGRVVTVTELKLVDERQQSIDTNAHLSINCGT